MRNEDGWWGTRREVDPPLPVWVELARVFPASRVTSADVPLRVRASGIDTTLTVAGEITSWHQTLTGDWWAQTRFEVANRAERARMLVSQLVPAAAVRPRHRSTDVKQ